jgi:hypothetical protein
LIFLLPNKRAELTEFVIFSRSETEMKKVLLTIAAIALFAVPASAQVLSIWADEGMTSCEHAGPAFAGFDVYLVLEPGTLGAFAAEYQLVIPANLLVQFTYPSDAISIVKDNPIGPPGVSVGFDVCQNQTFVLYHFYMVPLSDVPGHIQVIANGDTGKLIVAACIPDDIRPEVPCAVYNYFGFNDGCIVGTQESSWGAIKSMMD